MKKIVLLYIIVKCLAYKSRQIYMYANISFIKELFLLCIVLKKAMFAVYIQPERIVFSILTYITPS